MSALSLDRQDATDICEHCAGTIAVIRGSVYDGAEPAGLYVAGMHRCARAPSTASPVAILAIALVPPAGGAPEAVHLYVAATEDSYAMTFLDPEVSPWRTHRYLGRMPSAAEARASAMRERFFLVADRVVEDLPEIREYLAGTG